MNRFASLGLLSILSFSIYADDLPPGEGGSGTWQQPSGPSVQMLLTNYGKYLGYDFTQAPAASSALLAATTTVLSNSGSTPFFAILVDTFLGAIPVATNSPGTQPTFVPNANNPINSFANATFASYGSASQGSTDQSNSQSNNNLAINPSLDQLPYQSDPVSQGILNILSTPNYTYCLVLRKSQSVFDPNCQWLTAQQVTFYASPILPAQSPEKNEGSKKIPFMPEDYSRGLVSQLNSNSLIAPLMYSTESNSQGTKGLSAQNQLQEAANYIRYATGSITPPPIPDYASIYARANGQGDVKSAEAITKAQAILSNYFAKLRVYAAQSSVGYSNLYYMLSKRMPQAGAASAGSATAQQTSQALNEFNMSTWRLFDANGGASSWLDQINQAPAATVNKEMAVLLAEINYQLYLSRQLQERQLLTNTILLLESGRSSLPTSPEESASEPQS